MKSMTSSRGSATASASVSFGQDQELEDLADHRHDAVGLVPAGILGWVLGLLDETKVGEISCSAAGAGTLARRLAWVGTGGHGRPDWMICSISGEAEKGALPSKITLRICAECAHTH